MAKRFPAHPILVRNARIDRQRDRYTDRRTDRQTDGQVGRDRQNSMVRQEGR